MAFVIHGMTIFSIEYRKEYLLIPWVGQMAVEITGTLVFVSIICFNYVKYGWDQKTGRDIGVDVGCEGPCKEIMECLRSTLIRNTVTAIAYVVFLIYVELVAYSFYKHCTRNPQKLFLVRMK